MAFLFVVLLAATHYAIIYVGRGGVYGLAALSGLVDVDAFILGMTQSASTTPPNLAARGIIIVAARNCMAKGFYAFAFGGRETGRQALAFLPALAILGLLPLIWN